MIENTDSKLNTTDEKAKYLNELTKLHAPLQNAEQKADQMAVRIKVLETKYLRKLIIDKNENIAKLKFTVVPQNAPTLYRIY
jgi:phage shock protein A